jgi:hypothetical protein
MSAMPTFTVGAEGRGLVAAGDDGRVREQQLPQPRIERGAGNGGRLHHREQRTAVVHLRAARHTLYQRA